MPFTKLMLDNGILPGIKVDKGTTPLAGFPGEVVTDGLDGLRERLNEYAALGAKFAKWRAVININIEEGMPSDTCIEANVHALARYAALCQEAGIVPMVEPEVIMDGEHDIDDCYRGHRKSAACAVQCAVPAQRDAGRHHPESQHGHFRQGLR